MGIVNSQNSYIEVLTPNTSEFENRAFQELVILKLGH